MLISKLVEKNIIVLPEKTIPDYFREIVEYIEANYKENITLHTISQKFHISYSYCSKIFKLYMGKTFKQYLDFVRVCEVDKMLTINGKSITSAAYEAGFINISSFNRTYKRVRGCSPKRTKSAKF